MVRKKRCNLSPEAIEAVVCLKYWNLADNKLHDCKTREKSNFLKNVKMVISVKIQNFYRSRMTKWTSPLESSCEI